MVRQVLLTALALAAAAIGSLGHAQAAHEEQLREWSDPSGVFKVLAKLVTVDGEQVTLQRADGKSVTVPASRLSDADRKYLQAAAAGVNQGFQAVQRSIAEVWISDENYQVPVAGVYLWREGDVGYVIVPANQYQPATPSKPASQDIAVRLGHNRTEMTGVFVGRDEKRGIDYFKFKGETLPDPCPLARDVTGVENQALRVVGLLTASVGRQHATAHLSRDAVLTSIFRNRQGRITTLQVTGEQLHELNLGLVTDMQGAVLGMIQRRAGFEVMPVGTLIELFEPRIQAAALKPDGAAGAKATYALEITLIDPLGRLDKPILMAGRKGSVTRPAEPLLGGGWSQAAELTQKVELASGGTTSSTAGFGVHAKSGRIEGPGPNDSGQPPAYIVQVRITRDGDPPRWTEPFEVASAPSAVAAPGSSVTGAVPVAVPVAAQPTAAPGGNGAEFRLTSDQTLQTPLTEEQQQADNAWLAQAPQPQATETKLGGPAYKLDNVDATALQLPMKELAPRLTWSGDGKYLYALTTEGVVRKISAPGFVEELRLDLGTKCTGLDISAEGLVLISESTSMAFLVDARTLKPKRRFRVPVAAGIASSPALGTAYAAGGQVIYVLDLKSGAVANRIVGIENRVMADLEGGLVSPHLRATPDGKYLLSGTGALYRLRIEGTDLVQEQKSPGIINPKYYSIHMSVDGRHVLVPAMPGKVREFSTLARGLYLVDVQDMTRPVLAIRGDAFSPAMNVDPKSGNIYAPHDGAMLCVFAPGGTKLHSIRGDSNVKAILPHPEGGRLLVLTETSLIWLSLPDQLRQTTATANKAADDSDWVKSAAPQPKVSGRKLKREPLSDGGITATEVALSTKNLTFPLIWSEDGRWLYALEKDGVLHKLSVPDFEEERMLAAQAQAMSLGLSSEGLVVALDSLQNLWLVDPNTLKVTRRVPVAMHGRITCSPKHSTVIVGNGDTSITVLDLNRPNSARELVGRGLDADAKRLTPGTNVQPPTTIRDFQFTRDGNYLLMSDGSRLLRFKVQGTDLVLEQASEMIGGNSHRLCVSPDSKYVALPSGGGNHARTADFPNVGYGTYIFAIKDLSKPQVGISSGAYPVTIDVDPTTGRIFAQNADDRLLVYSPEGGKLFDYPGHALQRPWFSAYPGGNALLLAETDAVDGNLQFIELKP